MEETQIEINLDHHFNLALWCLWSSLIQPYIHEKEYDIKYIWKLKLVVCMSHLFELYVRGECT